MNSVEVKLEEPMETSAIKRFEAYVKGGRPEMKCLIKVGDDPLLCKISGLSPAQEYTVGVKACVHGKGQLWVNSWAD